VVTTEGGYAPNMAEGIKEMLEALVDEKDPPDDNIENVLPSTVTDISTTLYYVNKFNHNFSYLIFPYLPNNITCHCNWPKTHDMFDCNSCGQITHNDCGIGILDSNGNEIATQCIPCSEKKPLTEIQNRNVGCISTEINSEKKMKKKKKMKEKSNSNFLTSKPTELTECGFTDGDNPSNNCQEIDLEKHRMAELQKFEGCVKQIGGIHSCFVFV